jgi:hypothetical protein
MSNAMPPRMLLLLCAALLLVSCGRGAKWPVPLEPDHREAPDYEARDGCQSWDSPEVAVSVCPVDWVDAESVFSGDGMKNPFGDDPAVMSHLVFFSVKLENRGEEKLFFNPVWASLFAGEAVPKPPLDVSDVYRMNRDDSDADARARTFRKIAFDGTCSVAKGGEIERYLVFAPPKDTFEEMTVVLQDLYLGGKDFDPAFVFLPVESENP